MQNHETIGAAPPAEPRDSAPAGSKNDDEDRSDREARRWNNYAIRTQGLDPASLMGTCSAGPSWTLVKSQHQSQMNRINANVEKSS